MLYELFIAGKPVDLTENISIALNYTAIDCDTPTAEHGSYSKSVDLQGTKNNNEIFGSIYDLSRTMYSDNYELGGVHFDPRKRTEYKLWYNGDLLETGYVKLDSVKNTNGDITYSCTLYSDLGDFFYNLMYSQDGEEMTLADLNYNLKDISGNTINENTDTLFYWDKDYIYESWQALSGATDNSDRRVHRWITAAPTYSGYYDDFDNDSVLLNYDSLPVSGTAREILSPVFPDPDNPTTFRGWIRCKGTRDMDEWENRDLRSVNQRPAIKMSMILDAISDPNNNGGFEVEWDEEIKTSPYYTDTYLILNRLDFDIDETANDVNTLACNMPEILLQNGTFNTSVLYNSTDSSITTFDLSDVVSPRVSLGFASLFDFDVYTDWVGTDKSLYTSYYKIWTTIYPNVYYHAAHIFGGQVVRLSAWSGSTMLTSTPAYLTTTNIGDSTVEFGYKNPDWRERLKTQLGLQSGNDIVVRYDTIIYNDDARKYGWAVPLQLDLDLPSEDGISLHLDVAWVWFSADSTAVGGIAERTDKHRYYYYPLTKSSTILKYDDGYSTGIYNGTINPNVQKTNVNKAILFGESESPYKYLVGFTRMMGAKFRYDLSAKKIYINTREHYYLPQGHVIDGHIDRSKQIEIQPTLSEYKWCKYGFETPETYAATLYKRKNKYEYGEKKVDTGYYFNADTNNLFEDIPYTNGIPYLQNSIYYAVYSGVPSILVSPTLDVTNFTRSGDTIVEDDVKIKGYASFHTVNPLKDSTGDKICCFDNDNGPVDDLTNCLVFYNGKRTTVDWYQISNNIPIMQTLNNNPCYLYVSGNTQVIPARDATDPVYVCHWVKEIPVFSKYLSNSYGVYTDSLDFMKPNYTFVGNYENYQDGICIYDRYWNGYLEDLYEPNNKAVTVLMFLKENPDIAMRKFYYFDNCVWVISEITDFDISKDEPTQVKFIKVSNTGNYIPEAVVYDDLYDNWHEPVVEFEYRWVLSEETTCVDYDMYYLYKQQSRVICSNDEWVDVGGVYSIDGRGTMPPVLKEKDCFDCGYVAYRWVFSDDTTCVGFDKYGLYKEQYMSGSTQVWRDIVPEVTSIDADGTEEPVLIEINSTDCGYVPYEYQWRLSQEYICSGCDKYLLYIKQQRHVGDIEWEDVVPEVSSIDADGTMPVSATTCSTDCSPSKGTVGILINNWTNDCFCDGSIPANFYSGRTDLQVVDVHETITSLGDRAFEGCTNLRQIILKGSGTWYGHLCMGCTSLTAVTILGNYTVIQGWAFKDCTSLTSITIPDSITVLGGYGFEGCTNLQNITLGSGLTSVGVNMFNNCTNLTSITCNAPTAPTLGENVFRNVASAGTLYYPCDSDYSTWLSALPSGWTDYCHRWYMPEDNNYTTCSGTDKYYLYKFQVRDGEYEWRDVIPLQTSIDANGTKQPVMAEHNSFDCGYVEYRWTGTTEIICSGTSSYYAYKKQYRSAETGLQWQDVVPEELSINGGGTKTPIVKSDCSEECGHAILESYNSANTKTTYCCENGIVPYLGPSDYRVKVVVKEPMVALSGECFTQNIYLSSVTLPDTLKDIGDSAFKNCVRLPKIDIPSGVTHIGTSAFSQDYQISSVTIPSVSWVSPATFKECHNLKNVTFANPDSVKTIGVSAFTNCDISSVTIPDSVTRIENYAFYGNDLQTLVIGSGITYLGLNSFPNNNITSCTFRSMSPPNKANNFHLYHKSGETSTLYLPVGSDFSSWFAGSNSVFGTGWNVVYYNL